MKATMPITKVELEKYYAVRYKGKINMYLSPMLAIQQGLTEIDLKNLKNLHRKRLKLFDKIETETNPMMLHLLADQITNIDFELQDAWKFPRDIKYHTWWNQAPRCTCPKMDNKDMLGTNLRVVSESCPLHGKLPV